VAYTALLGIFNEYRFSDFLNSNQSSNLKIKNRYSKFFLVTIKMPMRAIKPAIDLISQSK